MRQHYNYKFKHEMYRERYFDTVEIILNVRVRRTIGINVIQIDPMGYNL